MLCDIMKRVFFTAFILTACIIEAAPSFAQSANPPSKAPAQDSAPAEKPKMDIDSFFEKAEQQTRKAQEKGNPNCVPKPKIEKPVDPVA